MLFYTRRWYVVAALLLALVLDYYGQAHGGRRLYVVYAVGYGHLVQQQAQASLAPFEKALALNPQYPDSHYNLAYTLMQLKRPAEAVPHAQESLRRVAAVAGRAPRQPARRVAGVLQKSRRAA